jgi:curli biogenesis system outer membrane secretion channel CsgG
MRAFLRLCVPILVALTVIAGGRALAQSSRPTVALLDFDFGSVQRWWSGNQDIGKGIADLIVDELVNDGSFRVIERKRLDAILAEQNFSNSQRADPSAKAVAAIGKALGVKYLIVGSITKFGVEDNKQSVNAGAFGGGKFGVGNVGKSQGKANVAITARMVDTTTGEIMASAKGDGTSKRSQLAFGSSNFHDTIIGEATEVAVKATVAKLIAAKSRLD